MATGPWIWNRPTAKLAAGELEGTLEVAQPARGIHELRLAGQAVVGSIFGVVVQSTSEPAVANLSLRDAYVRGGDLVAKYDQNGAQPIRMSAYWRVAPADDLQTSYPVLSLTISVETDLLDTHPTIQVATHLPTSEMQLVRDPGSTHPPSEPVILNAGKTAEVVADAATLVLYRDADRDVSYAEMTHPTDFHRLTVEQVESSNARAEWRLFGEFLEKGVIRRARMRGVWLPRDRDLERAIECYRDFAESKIPLTT